ncbi:uncharacterized protein EI97DRAFT_439110 [Westerdykella ornata]|uniref:F-box domain-containing protein n=1 Tax=Westerdykella ornata TaxID=318751 RepID=A0A6A6JTT9_WESOR|nr:uncharacterized protein EI97DRAFT_439110 [Westerdykella ornata]KAF2280021.1 hypothetical protein EI97DRAFT_439110 [Westerdykella ornata]
MEKLPVELLVRIFKHLHSLRNLLTLRGVARAFHDIADEYCTELLSSVGGAELHGFDDALLAIRLARIPYDSCCYYNKEREAYSFIPSAAFLHAVQKGKPVPPGCPVVPNMHWVQECAAVMDLYLTALAWTSTAMDTVNDAGMFVQGTSGTSNMTTYGPHLLEAYLRSFYRVHIFYTLFGPRVFAEPVLHAVARFGMTMGDNWYDIDDEAEIEEEVLEEMRRVPIWREPAAVHAVFDGFFEWLYAQNQPTNTIVRLNGRPPTIRHPFRICSETDRQILALLQFWKVCLQMHNRKLGKTPSEVHVDAGVSSYNWSLPHRVYRLPLRLSQWSNPQLIIDSWALPDIHSLVLENKYHVSASTAIYRACGGSDGMDPLESRFHQELKTRFSMEYNCDAAGLYFVIPIRSATRDGYLKHMYYSVEDRNGHPPDV